jgi:hypothetical protein
MGSQKMECFLKKNNIGKKQKEPEMGRTGDGEMGRTGDGEMGRTREPKSAAGTAFLHHPVTSF